MVSASPPRTRLSSPRFFSFLVTQFLGAANDNVFKMALTQLVLANVVGEALQTRYIGLATLLFPVPFLLLSPLAGYLADRFNKGRYLVFAKLPEVLAMGLAVFAFATGNMVFLLAVLFLMGAQSTFFSPVKYGLLPESFENKNLSLANGILETTTKLAILVGAVAGVFVYSGFEGRPAMVGVVMLAVALAGTVSALYVPRTPPGDRRARLQWNPLSATWANWKVAREIPVLSRTLFGIAYFGFLGSVFMIVVPVYGKGVLGLSDQRAGLMLMVLSIGIGLGSLAAGKLSQGRVEIGLVPLGAVGLTLFSFDLALFGEHGGPVPLLGLPWRAGIDLLMAGAAAGFYIVPLQSLLQQRSPEGMKGRIVAFSNVLSFTAVLLAAVLSLLLTELFAFGSAEILLTTAFLTLAATLYILRLLPESLVRLVLWLLVNTIYRIRVEGDRNVPETGGLLVANHVSWMDALLIGAATDRMVRFMMFRPFYETKGLNWFFRLMNVIPIAGGDTPQQKEDSLAQARREIENGHLVCIFAEGSITQTGNLLKFRRGFERIAHGLSVPIVPVFLDGVWGSIFSFERDRFLFKIPKQIPYPVRVLFGPPLPSSANAHQVRQGVQELSVAAFRLRKNGQRPLPEELLRTARRFWRRRFAGDSAGATLTFGQAQVRSLELCRALFAERSRDERYVGILLPPGLDAGVANLAVLAAGRAPVNLHPSIDILRSEVERAGLRRIVSRGDHLARLGIEPGALGAEPVLLETIEPGPRRRLALTARFLPFALSRRLLLDRGAEIDGTAAVVFSFRSGPAEPPAGAMLSHHNILSNMESLKQVFRISRSDRILGVLPFDNAFGLIGTLLIPAVVGVPVVYHDDPSDTGTIARLVREHALTVLPVAPSHLKRYTADVPRDAFASLRRVVVAGEPLDDASREAFAEAHGLEPLEGFGCAECSPLVSLNLPFASRHEGQQPGRRPGTVGHPLPGVAVRIVDPNSGEVLTGEVGELQVKGPNVMQGYLDDPERTAAVVEDGWFRTGHRARVDSDGFLTVLGAAVNP